MSEEVRNQANQILNWLDKAKFHDEDRALRAIQKIQQGPDAYIDPNLDVKENYSIINNRFNLVTKNQLFEEKLTAYQDMADSHYRDKMMNTREPNPPTIRGVDLPEVVGSFDITEAIEGDWYYDEQQSPKESGYNYWLTTVNFKPYSPLKQVIELAKEEYEQDELAEALRRFLRQGIPKVRERIDDSIPSAVTIIDYHEMARRGARYVEGEPHEYARLEDEAELPFDHERLPSESHRIVWWEDLYADWLADQIGLAKSSVIQMGIAEAGLALGEEGQLPEPLYEDIQHIIDECNEFLKDRAGTYMTAFRNTILEATIDGYGNRIVGLCKEESPHLYAKLVEDISDVVETFEDVDPELVASQFGSRKTEARAIEQLDLLKNRGLLHNHGDPEIARYSPS